RLRRLRAQGGKGAKEGHAADCTGRAPARQAAKPLLHRAALPLSLPVSTSSPSSPMKTLLALLTLLAVPALGAATFEGTVN
ncbi:hypothetical protein M3M33_16670, partial [Loigolactobacillus coryniformis]|uniref:hypothetical protein n=1 Tax=Loigolactobacillus coryniformis TaxID=1610 RepID=UPI00201A50F8